MQPKIPSMHNTQDMFTFIKELEEVKDYNNFSVPFDLSSLFQNIPKNETIELALNYILPVNLISTFVEKALKTVSFYCI